MINVEIEGLEELIAKLEKAAGGEFLKQAALWLEAMGLEFLDVVQDEIIRREIVDLRGLLNSFRKGSGENFWEIQSGSLKIKLEVGTRLEYASFINDGYPLVTERSASGAKRIGGRVVMYRWVPGEWNGDRFEYQKNADTGMLLTEQFIEGRPYFTDAETIFSLLFNQSLDRKLQEWIDIFFK